MRIGSQFFAIFDDMKPNSNLINVSITKDTHKILVEYIQNVDGKIGKFTEKAIKEKIERETLKKPKQAS